MAYGRNLVAELPAILNRPYLVVTMADLWPRFAPQLSDGLAAVHLVDSLEIEDLERLPGTLPRFETIVGLGGGMAIDVAKYLAWRLNRPLFQVPTSMSVNAPFAHRAAVRDQGVLKYVGWHVPEMVYVDYDVIRSAPEHINRSSVGDIVCYYTAHWDWRMARDTGNCEAKWPYEQYWVDQARAVLDGVLDAAEDIRAVNDAGIRALMGALRWGGAAFSNTGWNPRPIEGSEHTFFYATEHLTKKPFLHGQIVSLGVLLMSFLQGNDPDFIKGALDRIGVAYQPQDMGLTWEEVRAGLRHMPEYHKMAGNLWYTAATHLPITEAYLDEVQAWIGG
ncbi:iron-containing alcohol dehydrogenase [Bailinhaonella thermotolerans]|uniref:Iron-containing alcohol dehydrogenase n=1 Tax=Bailinhaonella thermotolerans TaxID=1070861 RepID=A0A3A4APH9_9ACTN|nr:iron-containing alcohol dehydrogenase [Bailinhaonella thermotolerans]